MQQVQRFSTVFWIRAVLAACLLINLMIILNWSLLEGTILQASLQPVYKALCHQIPSRSLCLGGQTMPVCARCLGVWMGFALAAIIGMLGEQRKPLWKPWLGCWLLCLMFLDWLVGCAGIVSAAWQMERTFSGLAGGFGMYVLLDCGVSFIATWLPTQLLWPGVSLQRLFYAGESPFEKKRQT